jgi:hypothetical protein
MKRVLIVILLFFGNAGKYLAFVPPLEREITLSLNNEKITIALNKIQEQTGLIFSYQPSIINNIGPVSLQLKHKTVREALAIMLPKNIIYKAKNKYIILKERPVEINPKKTEISGYVYDKTTEEKIPNVTIYDKQSLQSVTTDEYGFYSIKVPTTNQNISINKENYKDTVLSIEQTKDTKITNISIDPVKGDKKDSVEWRAKLRDFNEYTHQIFRKFKGYVNTINIKDTITRHFQVSLFPYIGTNHKLSGNVVNKLSFNVYGGYARGVNGFEMGGLFNIDEENVRGVQLAGIFNIVGDTVRGTQLAGLFNIVGKSSNGFQAAGMMNINDGRHKGFQAAGLMNVNEKIEGTGIAGMMNLSIAAKGGQIAGMANINDTLAGISVAGMFNINKYGKTSTQIAGMFNVADGGSTALQVAGLFNTAKYLKGIQIGLFNFSDTASGVPIGLFSFVKKGVHQIELSSDEMFSVSLAFRTGANAFHNIFTYGLDVNNGLWNLGYGAGTSVKLRKKTRGELSLTAHHVSKGQFHWAASDLYRFYVGVEHKFKKKFSVSGGPMFNIYVTDTYDTADYENIYSKVATYPLLKNSTDQNGFNTKMWVGAKIALRFL